MDTRTTALRLARQFKACEEGADRLLADTATLTAELAAARLASDAQSGTGQRALSRVIAAQTALAEAQQGLIRAHADMLLIGVERGDIPEGQCPDRTGSLSIAA